MSEFLDKMRMEMDPLADQLVSRIVAENGPDEAKKLFTILIRNVDIPFDQVPDYVKDYMEQNAVLPAAFDIQRIRRGQQVFLEEGLYFCVFLLFKSLPTCYLDAKGAQVLTLTGRMDGGRGYPEIYARRIAETLQFVLECMEPGSLDPGGKALKTILKIRLIHAAIRHFILKRPEWEAEAWQMPINQEDMALTLQTFSTTMVEGMEMLNVPLADDRAGDYHYAWQAVGHVLGQRADLNPETIEKGRALKQQILDRNAVASEAGKSLTAALIAFGEDLFPTKVFDWSSEALVNFFLGPNYAGMLGAESDGCLQKLLPKLLLKMVSSGSKLEQKSDLHEKLADKIGMAIVHGLQKKISKQKGIGLVVPEQLKAAWGA